MARLLSRAVALKNMFCAFCVFPVGLIMYRLKSGSRSRTLLHKQIVTFLLLYQHCLLCECFFLSFFKGPGYTERQKADQRNSIGLSSRCRFKA